MQQLLIGVTKAFLPFIVIYLFWVVFFAIISINLGNNESLAKSYTGTGDVIGYFMVTFENSLGNISAPSMDFVHAEISDKFID